MLLLPLFTMAQSNKKVAVYVMGDDPGLNKVFGSKLQTAIASSEGYTAIERTAAFLAELRKNKNINVQGRWMTVTSHAWENNLVYNMFVLLRYLRPSVRNIFLPA